MQGNNQGYGYQEFRAANPVRPIRNEYLPDFMTPLGETLEEALAARGMTRAELASLTSYSLSIINEIIACDAAVTSEIAMLLE